MTATKSPPNKLALIFGPRKSHNVYPMLRILVFTFIVLLILLLFGFGGSLAVGAFPLAQVLFYCFVLLVLLFLLLGPGLIKRR